MVLCLFIYFLAVHFDWSIILIRKSFRASRHISGKLGVKLAIGELKIPHSLGLWQDNMVISAFSNVQKQYLVVQRQFMPQMVIHGVTKLDRQNH